MSDHLAELETNYFKYKAEGNKGAALAVGMDIYCIHFSWYQGQIRGLMAIRKNMEKTHRSKIWFMKTFVNKNYEHPLIISLNNEIKTKQSLLFNILFDGLEMSREDIDSGEDPGRRKCSIGGIN